VETFMSILGILLWIVGISMLIAGAITGNVAMSVSGAGLFIGVKVTFYE
jgi:hypothetical protein